MVPKPNDGTDVIEIEDPLNLYRFRKESSDSCDSVDLGISVAKSTTSEESLDLLPDIKIDSPDSYYDADGYYDAEAAYEDQNRADSGVDSEKDATPEFIPPDIDLAQKIVDQVEYYFSDESIMKDAFLLKHVRRNKEGYVSLKLIASFKKVKHISKDWRVIAYALQESEELEINEQSTKIRRKKPLPEFDETTTSRSVIAVNLSVEKPTVENVSQLFKEYGEIALVRILKPGTSIPNEVRQVLNKHQVQLEKTVCAVVEFEKSEAAREAVNKMSAKNDDWRSQTMVLALLKPAKKSTKKSNKKTEEAPAVAEKEQAQPEARRRKPKKPKTKANRDARRDSQTEYGNQHSRYNSECSLSTSPGNQSLLSHRLLSQSRSDNSGYRQKSFSVTSADNPMNQGSWRQRSRLQSTSELNNDWRKADSTVSSVPVNVLRLPRGPDGTKGFYPNSMLPKLRTVSAPMPIPY